MMRLLEAVIAFLFFLLTLPLWLLSGRDLPELRSQTEIVSDVLDLDLSGCELQEQFDDHEGILQDGSTFCRFACGSDSVLTQLRADPRWRPLPADEPVKTILYGSAQRAPLCAEGMIPQIERGYFRLIDHQLETGRGVPEGELLERFSYNFSLGLYDEDSNTLYYFRLDT